MIGGSLVLAGRRARQGLRRRWVRRRLPCTMPGCVRRSDPIPAAAVPLCRPCYRDLVADALTGTGHGGGPGC